MMGLFQQMMQIMNKQEERANKQEERANKQEERAIQRERSRSRRRKAQDTAESDDDAHQDGSPSVDVSGCLAKCGLRVNAGFLPATKTIAKCVRQARKFVKAGSVPIIGGKLDERFVPCGQRASPWVAEMDVDKLRLQTWWTLWWGRVHTQLVCQAATGSQAFTLGQIHEWQSNVSQIVLAENATVAMKYEEIAYSHVVAQIEAKATSVDTSALFDLCGTTLAKARLMVEKSQASKKQPEPNKGGARSSWQGSKQHQAWGGQQSWHAHSWNADKKKGSGKGKKGSGGTSHGGDQGAATKKENTA